MGSDAGLWWMPGVLIGSVGVLAFVGGFATGGPDVVGGVVFGGVALAAAAVILWRRSPKQGGSEPREGAEPSAAPGRRRWWRFWGS
ncbi:hypothetical protein [Zavarzinella formosa]|uniref:hypothetical protein n=1 Tax=Zavarzinella formosa TaxID=360055 RepID=UPI0002D95DD0|nr:hypothetical protein [Zavarzinella formosa]